MVKGPPKGVALSMDQGGLIENDAQELRQEILASQSIVGEDGQVLFWVVSNRVYENWVAQIEALDPDAAKAKGDGPL